MNLFISILYYFVLYCLVLYCLVLYCFVLYCFALYDVTLYGVTLNRRAFYCILTRSTLFGKQSISSVPPRLKSDAERR